MSRAWLSLPLLSLLALGLVSCGGGKPDVDTRTDAGPVVFGAIYNETGEYASYGITSTRGARLAVSQANQSGGVLNRTLELVVIDGKSTGPSVAAAATSILAEHPTISALMGLSETDMVLAAAPVAKANNRVFLTSGATSPLLPVKFPKTVFLACFGDNVQAAVGAEWAYRALGIRTVSMLYNSTRSYPTLLQGYFRNRFKELGGAVVSVVGYGEDDFQESIGRLKPADLVYLATMTPEEAVEGVRWLREAGFNGPILGGDGYDDPQAWMPEQTVEDVYFTTHVYLGEDSTNPQVAAFRRDFAAAYGGDAPDAFAALSYDAAGLLARAIRDAGDAGPDAVRQSLAQIKDYQGVTGTISFGPDGHIPKKSVTILEIAGGREKFVTQFVPDKVPAPHDYQ